MTTHCSSNWSPSLLFSVSVFVGSGCSGDAEPLPATMSLVTTADETSSEFTQGSTASEVAEISEVGHTSMEPIDESNEPDVATSDSPDEDTAGDDVDTFLASDSTSNEVDKLLQLPEGFPRPHIPEENPLSAAGIELGRHLFYDKRLSGNGEQACSSCHFQEFAFADAKVTATGSTGELLARNSPGLTNTAYNQTLTWVNPGLEFLEQQLQIPLFGEFPVELGVTGSEDEVLGRFEESELYQAMFSEAFPQDEEPINFDRIVKALSSFVRSMVSSDSAYDRDQAGDTGAMSDSAKRGEELFFSERLECHHCHGGFNFSLATRHENSTFTQVAFQNTGLYNLDGEGAYPSNNTGLYEFTFNPEDMGRFRPPSLRNVALTAPYFHDGSTATLEEVLDIYAAGGRVIPEGEPNAGDGTASPYKDGLVSGFSMTEQDRTDLVAFLESLTDEAFITDERFSDPFLP